MKLSLDAEVYEKRIYDNVYKPSFKGEIDHHDIKYYWPNSIKETIQWSNFLSIMEHTTRNENIVEVIAIKCINCNKETGLYLKDKTIE